MLLKKGLPKVLGFTSEAIHAYRDRPKGSQQGSLTESSSIELPAGTDAPASYYGEDGSEIPNGLTTNDGRRIPQYFYAPDGTWIPNVSNLPADATPGRQSASSRSSGDAQNNAKTGSNPNPSQSIHDDEAVWQLDDMAASLDPPHYDQAIRDETLGDEEADQTEDEKIRKREKLVRELMNMAGPVPKPPQRLPCAVIIPQRRPGKKDRGFCRAYAPILSQSGIDEATFIQFIESFDVANKANPFIEVTFIAGGILGFVPNATAQIVGAIVQVVAGTAKELQARNRANTFLDRVNQEIFMPRGLCAMVMSFKKDDKSGLKSIGKLFRTEKVDINDPNAGEHESSEVNPYDHLNEAATKHHTTQEGEGWWKKNVKKIREYDGPTKGDVQLPESAPLVFPQLDAAVQEDGTAPQGFKGNMDAAGNWVQDYMDRQAHAKLEREKLGSSLAVSSDQRKPFKSRFNDPDHPANSGSLISLVTGGAVAMPSRRQMGTDRLRQFRGGSTQQEQGQAGQGGRQQRSEMPIGLMSVVKKLKKDDIFYLVVINMPTQEEIDAATAELGELGQDAPAEAQPTAEAMRPALGEEAGYVYSPDNVGQGNPFGHPASASAVPMPLSQDPGYYYSSNTAQQDPYSGFAPPTHQPVHGQQWASGVSAPVSQDPRYYSASAATHQDPYGQPAPSHSAAAYGAPYPATEVPPPYYGQEHSQRPC